MFTKILITLLALLGAAQLSAVSFSGEIVFPTGPDWYQGPHEFAVTTFRLEGPNFSVQGRALSAWWESPCRFGCLPGALSLGNLWVGGWNPEGGEQTYIDSGTFNGVPLHGPGGSPRSWWEGDPFTYLDISGRGITLTDSLVYSFPVHATGVLAVYDGSVCVTCIRHDFPEGPYLYEALPLSGRGIATLRLQTGTFDGIPVVQFESLVMQFTAVPEPSSYGLVAAAFAALLTRRRLTMATRQHKP